jgi:type IV pilus assembly protein PilA
MKNQKSMGNKGFSLVELIVVIAIMAVLVGVLAPQFVKYVEKSRKATDVQNAQEIVTALEVALADEEYTVDGATVTFNSDEIEVTEADGTNAGDALTDAGINLSTQIKSSDYSEGITFTVSSNAVYGDGGTLSEDLGLSTESVSNEADSNPGE